MKEIKLWLSYLVSELLGTSIVELTAHLSPEESKILQRLQRLQKSAEGLSADLDLGLRPAHIPFERDEFLEAVTWDIQQSLGIPEEAAAKYAAEAWDRIRTNGVRINVDPLGKLEAVELNIGL